MTPTAAGCEEPTREELRHTRLESKGYSRCDADTQAPNTRQVGVHCSEPDTHPHTKHGATERCPVRNTWARAESVTLPVLQKTGPKLPQKLAKSALKHKP